MKGNLFIVSVLLSLVCVATSCRSGKGESDIILCDTVYSPRYASGFVVTGDSTLRQITVKSPWQGADSVVTRLLVLGEGGEAPAGYDGQIIKGPVRRIVCMSSTHVAMLEKLGLAGLIVGVSGVDYLNSPGLVARKAEILDVGYDGNMNYENIMAANPDIVLLYGVNGASSMTGKLDEMSIPYIYIGDYLEESPLGKVEWLRVIGEITGRRQEADELLARTASRYDSLCQIVTDARASRPSVMVNAPYGDSWTVPPVDSYVATLIKDAGGRYIYDNIRGNTSVAVDMEDVFLKANKADFWLNAGNFTTMDQLKNSMPKFAVTAPVGNSRVYTNNLRVNAAGGNDYYESGAVSPDVVLQDIISILHPELVPAGYTPKYYRHLE